MDDYEPMDVDLSGSSASKMDISCNDIDLSIVKKEKDFDDSSTVTSILEGEKDFNDIPLLKKFIKQEKDVNDIFLVKSFINQEQDVYDTTTLKSTGATRTPLIQQKPFSKLNRYHINRNRKQKKFKKILGYKTCWVATSMIILAIAIITYQIIGSKCIEELDLQLINEKLSKNLYGQVEAVEGILHALETKERSKILVLYGGTGVGKTYATSMILEDILSCSNVYHFTMPSFADNFSPEYLFGLTVCNNSIVVVDDLTINDKNIKNHIDVIMDKSKDLGKSMTIILVYNCDVVAQGFVKRCNDEFLHALKQNLNGIKAAMYYIKFNRLKLDNLIQCIVKELEKMVLPIDEMMLAEILIHFNVTQDGCKSVNSKINFLIDG